MDIGYSISSINLVDIRYSDVKIRQINIQIQSQKDFFKEILNIQYQSGGYSIFNIQYQSGGYSIFRCENLPEGHSNSKLNIIFLKKL